MVLLFFLAFCKALFFSVVFVELLSSLTVHCRAFSLAFFYVAIVVSVFDLFSILSGSFNSECFLWGWGWAGGGRSYTFLYPALLVVLFWFAFLSVSLLLACF